MAELRQVLSNETINDHNMVVLSDGIDWSRYEKNPVLLENHDWDSQPIGNVVNIHREGNDWIGTLKFAEGTERGKTAKYLYENGFYRAVSVGGVSREIEDESTGVKYATYFLVYEVSLCSLQSNSDAVSDFKGEKVMLAAEFAPSQTERITTLSAKDHSLINKYKSNMTQEDPKDGTIQKEDMTQEDSSGKRRQWEGPAKEATTLSAAEPVPAAENEAELRTLNAEDTESIAEKIVTKLKSFFGAAGKEAEKQPDPQKAPEPEPKPTTLTSDTEVGTQHKEATSEAGKAQIIDPHKINLKASMETNKTLHQFLATTEGKTKFNAAARLLTVAPTDVCRPEHASKVEAARELAAIVSSDEGFKAFMGNINVRNGEGRYEKLSTIAERTAVKLASGANSSDFVTTSPDLAVVEWLSLFYQQLLPANTWAARCARTSGSDKQGIIWVESAISPKIYYGDRAPLNVADYLYDDDPIGLVTKVFSLQPILWQAANTDILAYDDRSWGQSEAVRFMVNAIHNYALQKIAEGAGASVPMSGVAADGTVKHFAAADAFPVNSKAAGDLLELSPNDLIKAQTKFVNWNYDIKDGDIDCVMDAAYMEQLLSNPYLTSLLTKTAGEMRPMLGKYSAFNFMSRSTTSAYDTATSKVVDPELYCDGKVQANGTIPEYTAPVLAATAYGLAISFIPSQVILAMGNTNVHVVADPNSYGWKFSMDMRFGAGSARKGGKGIVNIVPAKYIAPEP